MGYLAASEASPALPVLGIVAYVLGIAVIIYMWSIRQSYLEEGKRVAKLLKASREARASRQAGARHYSFDTEGRAPEQLELAELRLEADLDDVPIAAIAASDDARGEWLKRLNATNQANKDGPPGADASSGEQKGAGV
jgi:hypothetical protein